MSENKPEVNRENQNGSEVKKKIQIKPEVKAEKQKSFADVLKYLLKRAVLHNGGFKLIAVLISIVLWAGLISQDPNVTRDKVFQNVSVNVINSDTMKRNSYIVVNDLNEALSGVSAVAAVPQPQYEAAEVSAYNIRLDLSRVTGSGEQEVRLLSTNSSTYGKITSINPATVKLEVEDYVVRYRIPVSVSIVGETPPGWYMSTPSVDPPLVVVSGPKSLVNSISRARAFLDSREIDWEEGTTVMTAELKLYNRSGEEVNSDLLEISYNSLSLDSVVLESTILPTKSFEVSDMIGTLNSVAEGYEVEAIHVSPENITVAARQDVLGQMTDLPLQERFVDLNGLTETTTFQIKVNKPNEDAVLSNDTINVTVEVVPEGD